MGIPQQRERVTVDGLGNIGRGKYKKSVEKSSESGIIKSRLSERDIQAINRYTSSDSYKINEKLRSGLELSDDEKEFISDLDKALDKLHSYEGIVYRSMVSDMIPDIQEFIKLHQPGGYVKYSAYTSSSLEFYDDTMDIQFVIQSKNGKDITDFNPNEQEVLFKRDSWLYISRIQNNVIYLEEC